MICRINFRNVSLTGLQPHPLTTTTISLIIVITVGRFCLRCATLPLCHNQKNRHQECYNINNYKTTTASSSSSSSPPPSSSYHRRHHRNHQHDQHHHCHRRMSHHTDILYTENQRQNFVILLSRTYTHTHTHTRSRTRKHTYDTSSKRIAVKRAGCSAHWIQNP